MSKINNLPEYAYGYRYILATPVEDELWFYGAYGNYMQALNIAEDINAVMIINEEVSAC